MLLLELFRLFDRYNTNNRRPQTATFYRTQLAKLVQLHGDMPADELRPHHLLELKATWHLCLAIQRLFRWAHEEAKLVAANPMDKLERPRLRSRQRVLTQTDTARLLRHSCRTFRFFLLAAREAAARPQELRTLEWTDLRWEGGRAELKEALASGMAYFELHDYKGRDRRTDPSEPRIIPVSPRFGRMLWRLARRSTFTGLIFTGERGQPWNRNSLRCQMRRLRERIGIPVIVRGERIVCYSMRHTTATRLADEGLQTSVLQLLLGHADIKTTQRYLHIRKKNLMDAWKRHHDKPDGQRQP